MAPDETGGPAAFVLLLFGEPEPLVPDSPDAENAEGQRGQKDGEKENEDQLLLFPEGDG